MYCSHSGAIAGDLLLHHRIAVEEPHAQALAVLPEPESLDRGSRERRGDRAGHDANIVGPLARGELLGASCSARAARVVTAGMRRSTPSLLAGHAELLPQVEILIERTATFGLSSARSGRVAGASAMSARRG